MKKNTFLFIGILASLSGLFSSHRVLPVDVEFPVQRVTGKKRQACPTCGHKPRSRFAKGLLITGACAGIACSFVAGALVALSQFSGGYNK